MPHIPATLVIAGMFVFGIPSGSAAALVGPKASSKSTNSALPKPAVNTSSSPSHSHTNRLSREKSPYLLQHQHNPVEWFAWGADAFEKARKEDKPIFLSIGYSTCHWCHVMERECFESESIAEILNQHFVSIKVDREERPDVDKIYMSFVQATTGSGGWPLNVFLTPSLKPFYGGTYFPPQAKSGRAGFPQVLTEIHKAWTTRKSQVMESAEHVHSQLLSFTEVEPSKEAALVPAVLRHAVDRFKREFDPINGGFGHAPKFPRPSQPALLLRQARATGDLESIRMVSHTGVKMARGGMNDQLGGGFARYSVDERWLVPHFEKMLYDNAQLAQLYLDLWLVDGNALFAETVRATLDYVLRDMTHPGGGFYSAEDADSEGKEGKFYCWTKQELEQALTAEENAWAVKYYGVTAHGNFVDHSDPAPLPNQNVLHIATDSPLDAAGREMLERVRAKLMAVRSRRVRPHLDDKILVSWNGMMLGAMARAGITLPEPRYLAAAEKNLAFLKEKLWDEKTRTLYHRWRDGERDQVQLLDAYSNLLNGVVDLYESTLDGRHLEFAIHLAESMVARFHDSKTGGFWQNGGGDPELILKVKDDYDGAEPSGNSVAIHALLRLSAITDRAEWKEIAEKGLQLFAQRMQQAPQALPAMLGALDFYLNEPKRVVIAGTPSSTQAKALLQATHNVYEPNRVILGVAGPVEPFARSLKPQETAEATAYVCTGNACQPPASDVEKLKAILRGK